MPNKYREETLDWQQNAACRGTDIEIWFSGRHFQRAKEICSGCPVKRQCLSFALTCEQNHYPYHRWGIYGGLTATQRAALTRRTTEPRRGDKREDRAA